MKWRSVIKIHPHTALPLPDDKVKYPCMKRSLVVLPTATFTHPITGDKLGPSPKRRVLNAYRRHGRMAKRISHLDTKWKRMISFTFQPLYHSGRLGSKCIER